MPTPAEDLNTALRDLIDTVRTADLDGVDLGAEIDTIRSVTDGLHPHRHEGIRMQAGLHFGATDGAPGSENFSISRDNSPNRFFPYSPVVGLLNPIAPPVRMWMVDGESGLEMHGEASFGAPYNGPPGCVHGGVIAATFDELLGSVCVVNGLGGFTGTLTVVYRSTTPLEETVTMRGWHDRTEGRKVFARGELHHGERLCAEVEGIFILSPDLPNAMGAG